MPVADAHYPFINCCYVLVLNLPRNSSLMLISYLVSFSGMHYWASPWNSSMDAVIIKSLSLDQAAIDIGHLYSFLHQLHSLKVVPPVPPSSVTRMAFEVTPFRSMDTLKVDAPFKE